jgi:hypothetical protein
MFSIILVSSGIACYVNYYFDSTLSRNVFYMFAGAVVADLFIIRPILLLLLSLLRYFISLCQGYRSISVKRGEKV